MKAEAKNMLLCEDIPAARGGAPEPFVFSDEHNLEIIYSISPPASERIGGKYEALTEEDGEDIAALRFTRCLQHKFGYPNEEAISGHPLWSHGLEYCACTELQGSDWLAEITKQNEVHARHKESMFSSYRHFIFPFHDTTFECLAEGYEVRIYKAWHHQVLQERLKSFSEWLREETQPSPSSALCS